MVCWWFDGWFASFSQKKKNGHQGELSPMQGESENQEEIVRERAMVGIPSNFSM
jgi:hypothetical protein